MGVFFTKVNSWGLCSHNETAVNVVENSDMVGFPRLDAAGGLTQGGCNIFSYRDAVGNGESAPLPEISKS